MALHHYLVKDIFQMLSLPFTSLFFFWPVPLHHYLEGPLWIISLLLMAVQLMGHLICICQNTQLQWLELSICDVKIPDKLWDFLFCTLLYVSIGQILLTYKMGLTRHLRRNIDVLSFLFYFIDFAIDLEEKCCSIVKLKSTYHVVHHDNGYYICCHGNSKKPRATYFWL